MVSGLVASSFLAFFSCFFAMFYFLRLVCPIAWRRRILCTLRAKFARESKIWHLLAGLADARMRQGVFGRRTAGLTLT
jgi:hypothetical protein